MALDRQKADELLRRDDELGAVDPERFHLDLSEIADESRAISALIESGDSASASELMTGLVGKMAHLSSHWRSLARLTDYSDVYDEIDKTYGTVNGDSSPWWRRFRSRG